MASHVALIDATGNRGAARASSERMWSASDISPGREGENKSECKGLPPGRVAEWRTGGVQDMYLTFGREGMGLMISTIQKTKAKD